VSESDAGMATCMVCQPPEEMPAVRILDHLRLFHPEQYGDGPEQWPDGGFVMTPETDALTPEAIITREDGDA
jgi:hypothetical protein